MPSSVQGIGTEFFGECDFHQDGSYITTTFFVLFHIPVIALKSQRVSQTGSSSSRYGNQTTTTTNYLNHGQVPLCALQILRVYLFLASIPLLTWLWFGNPGFFDVLLRAGPREEYYQWISVGLTAASYILLFCLPVILRKQARKRAGL